MDNQRNEYLCWQHMRDIFKGDNMFNQAGPEDDWEGSSQDQGEYDEESNS